MSEIDNPRALFESTCPTNSEPYALQNFGDMMSPEFSENCIIIVDPAMPIHNQAYAIIDYKGELYFRQYIELDDSKAMRCLNPSYPDIELNGEYQIRGCVVQQKQRKQKTLHYYLKGSGKDSAFTKQGKVLEKNQ